jgi:hypothetical protein
MSNVTLDQQTTLATWPQHAYAEFVLKDADAALATMIRKPVCVHNLIAHRASSREARRATLKC